MTSTFSVPADLADSDLGMKQITQIKGIRTIRDASQRTLDGPGPRAIRMARARIEWASDAEDAVKGGATVPPMPGPKPDQADPEDYLGDDE